MRLRAADARHQLHAEERGWASNCRRQRGGCVQWFKETDQNSARFEFGLIAGFRGIHDRQQVGIAQKRVSVGRNGCTGLGISGVRSSCTDARACLDGDGDPLRQQRFQALWQEGDTSLSWSSFLENA